MSDFKRLFTFQGRIERKRYWLGSIVVVFIALLVGFLLGVLDDRSLGGRVILFVISATALYPLAALTVQRLYDRDMNGNAVWLMVIPTAINMVTDLLGVTGDIERLNDLDLFFLAVEAGVGIVYLIELGCIRGTAGPNHYGPDPLADT